MKKNKNIKLNIYLICFLAAITTVLCAAKVQAKSLITDKICAKITADTSASDSYKNVAGIQQNVFNKEGRALQRLQLLDKLSKQPAENPEVFSNAREEYLYFEKAKAELEEHDNAIKELNMLIPRILW